MSPDEPPTADAAGDYVVRHGWRGFAAAVLGLLVWTGLGVADWAYHPPHFDSRTFLVLLAVEAAFVIACGTKLRQALERQVVFAVRPDAVYFGPDGRRDPETIPWNRISAVELFRERAHPGRNGSSYRCVGVRTPGTSQVPRPGSGPAAQPLPERSAAHILRSGRPDLIPGADGTIRLAYRQQSGWRISRARLTAAVGQYAPGVPVIDGPTWPPALNWGDAHRAYPRREL